MAHKRPTPTTPGDGNGLAPDDVRDLLPWYVNGTLSPAEEEAVEAWLARHPEAHAEVEALRRLRDAVAAQPLLAPSEQVWAHLQARVSRVQSRRPRWLVWAWGSVVALLLFLTLWAVVQPGIVLRWQVEGAPAAAVRVWRVAEGGQPVLLALVPLAPDRPTGAVVDPLVRPWGTYTYKVEMLNGAGQVVWWRTAVARADGVWSYHLVLGIVSLLSGWGMAVALERLRAWREGKAARPV